MKFRGLDLDASSKPSMVKRRMESGMVQQGAEISVYNADSVR